MNGAVLFIIIFFSVLVVFGILLSLFLFGRSTVKNNPNKAIVLVKNGNETKAYKGKLSEKPSNKGSRYTYDNRTVLVPASYGEVYHKNKRLIFINRLGQLIASPLENDIELSPDERDLLIYELVESNIGANIVHAIKGGKTMNVIIIGVIAFIIGILAVIGYNYMSKAMNKPASTPQQNTEQPAPIITEGNINE